MAQLNDLIVMGRASFLNEIKGKIDWTNINNKPTIPTVNNATLTIQKNGTNVQTFTANQSTNATANITVPTKVSELTNDSGYTKNTGTVTSVKISATSPIAIDSSAAITTSGERTISHANSGVTAGTYRSVTVNATGHVTAGTNPTTISGYGITDAKISNGTITLGSNTITPLTSSSTLNATKLSGTIPSSCYTDTNNAVTQTATDSTDATYELLFSETADNTTRTEGARKSQYATFNPSKQAFTFGTRASNSTVGNNSYAEGYGVIASGTISYAEGAGTTASGDYSHAEGGGTKASNSQSHAEGAATTASGSSSHSEGAGTTASGDYSHAEGGGTKATKDGSHAEGGNTIASGDYSHSEGADTKASGDYSHSEGNSTTASGYVSHAEGLSTTASGSQSHAEGGGTTASGDASHAEGGGTKANHRSQHVFGEYNIEDPSTATSSVRGNYVEIVGNGTSSTHSNARTLDWDGNEWLAGGLTLAGTSGDITLSGSGNSWDGTNTSLKSALAGKASSATTLAGYGITDAKIEDGTITLGGNSITPITSHQSVSNANASLFPGDTGVTIATIGTTPITLSLDPIGYYNAIRVGGSSLTETFEAEEAGGNRFTIVAGEGIDFRKYDGEDGIWIDSTFDPDTKVSKSGDTMTGELIVKNHEITLKYQSADITLANNGVSANIWRYCRWHDTNSKYSGYIGNGVFTDGKVRTTLVTRNYKTNSTTYVDNALTLDVAKDGTRSVAVSDPAAWRTALGLGSAATYDVSVIEDNSSGNVSVAKTTWKTMNTITLTKGFYIIQLYAEWASAKGFSRQLIFSTSKNSGSALGYRFKDFRSLYNNTSQCMNNVCFPLYVSANTTYYVNVRHNSDSAVDCITRVAYFKLI